MTNYFRKPDALVDAVRSILSGQPTETQEDIQRKSDVKMVKVKLPDGHMVMRRERPKIEIGKGKNESLDPVDQKALKGKHSDRKDKDIDNDGDVDSSDEYLHKRRKAVSKAMKEGVEDNPANTQHLCAKNVVHESWGEGSCIPTMHADPDEEGNVAWYDVMFDHGIEEQVSIEELKVTKAESHIHSSKKKIKESKDEYEDDDDDSDEDEKNGKKKKVSGKKDDVDVEPEMDDTKMVTEKEMTPAQEKKREEIVLSMKKEMPRFKKKYGDRAKDVMYATATKMAMKEGFELGIEKSDLIEEVELDEAKIAKKVPAKDGGHFVVLHRDTSGMRGTQDKFHMRHLKNGKVKDYGTHHSMDGALKFAKNRGIIEEVELDEAKSGTGYDLYHKDFSSAMQHAYDHAKKKHGITINPKEIDDKVATGPAKPKEGKTNSYRLKGDKGAIQVQVYNKGGSKPFELNMYKEEVELDEAKVTKKMIDDLEDRNEHGMVALKLAQAYGTAAEVKKVQDINKRHNQRGHIEHKDQKERDVIIRKYYKMAEEVELDEAKNYEIKNGKIHISKANFRKVHKDYKNSTKGKERMMALDPKSGATTSYEVVFEEVELDEAISASSAYALVIQQKDGSREIVAKGSKEKMKSAAKKYGGLKQGKVFISLTGKKVGDKILGIGEEVELDEGRGRPRKDGTTGGSEDRENIQMQLRKSVSLRGLKDVEFADGKKVKVPAKVAQGVMSKINSIKDAKQKQNAVQHIAKSHKHMMDFHKGDYKDADAKRQDILKLK